ncbi:type IV secretory system conjugative DNA transfer family protein [Thermaerobacter litoralis]
MRLVLLKLRARWLGQLNRLARTIPWPITMVTGYALVILALLALAWPHLWILHGGWGPWWFFLLATLGGVCWTLLLLSGLANVGRGRIAAGGVLAAVPLWFWAWVEWTLAGTLTRWVLATPVESFAHPNWPMDAYAHGLLADWFLWPARVGAALSLWGGVVLYRRRNLAAVDLHRVMAETGRLAPGDVVIGYDETTGNEIILREKDRTMHMLVLGPPGTGKTAGVLAPMAAQDLSQPDIGVTIIEPKGDWVHAFGNMPGALEIARYHGREVYLLDPTDPHSDAINPLAGPVDVVAAVNAAALEATQESGEEYFRQMARTVFGNVIKLLKYLEVMHPNKEEFGNPTYLEVAKALNDNQYLEYLVRELAAAIGADLVLPSPDEVQGRNQRAQLRPRLHLAGPLANEPVGRLLAWFVNDYLAPETRESFRTHALGLRLYVEQLFSHEGFLRLFVPDGRRRVVDLDRHLEQASVLLVNTSRGEAPLLSRLLGTLVSLHLSYAVQRRKGPEFQSGKRKTPLHVLYMDEFASYVNEEFAAFLEQARGYNFAAVLGTQSLADFERVGKYFRAQMLGTIRNYVVYGGIAVPDAKYFSDSFGTAPQLEESESETRRYDGATLGPDQSTVSVSRRWVERPRFSIRDLRELPPNTFVYQILQNRALLEARRGKAKMIDAADYPGWEKLVRRTDGAGQEDTGESPAQVPAAHDPQPALAMEDAAEDLFLPVGAAAPDAAGDTRGPGLDAGASPRPAPKTVAGPRGPVIRAPVRRLPPRR